MRFFTHLPGTGPPPCKAGRPGRTHQGRPASGPACPASVRPPGHARPRTTQLPATDADALADRDAQAARLQARIKRIETAQNSQILELEQLPADPADTASAAMRARIRARFADLHHEREQIETQLQALAKTTPAAADPALLDELPALGDILPSLPPALKARLFAAFGLEILWNKPGRQATVFVEITENTLQAIPGITDPSQDGYHDTDNTGTHADQPEPMWDLGNTPRVNRVSHPLILRCYGCGRGDGRGLGWVRVWSEPQAQGPGTGGGVPAQFIYPGCHALTGRCLDPPEFEFRLAWLGPGVSPPLPVDHPVLQDRADGVQPASPNEPGRPAILPSLNLYRLAVHPIHVLPPVFSAHAQC